jgi:hypothetical protein
MKKNLMTEDMDHSAASLLQEKREIKKISSVFSV